MAALQRFKTGADAVLSLGPAQRLALRGAGRLGRDLVFLWHRVRPEGGTPNEVVPSVSVATFKAQLDELRQLGRIVPLAALQAPSADPAPRFALTFDDDDEGHSRWTLPALQQRGLSATFFLSGRWLHDDGPYWWEHLEQEIRDAGPGVVARRHRLPDDLTAAGIAQRLTGTRAAWELREGSIRRGRPPMTEGSARRLVEAGMEIGFHTRHHDVLPLLKGPALTEALTDGRRQLEDALGVCTQQFAYPHGRADARVAAATAAAGFQQAWTTTKVRARRDDPPMLRGRWDLATLSVDDLRRRVLRALVRLRD